MSCRTSLQIVYEFVHYSVWIDIWRAKSGYANVVSKRYVGYTTSLTITFSKTFSRFSCMFRNKSLSLRQNQFKKEVVMPKIFEYFGFIFLFYSNEHEPIHVHVMKDGHEAIFEINTFN